MKFTIDWLVDLIFRQLLVEFDYQDGSSTRHGRCYVRSLFSSEETVKRAMQNVGYTNIHIRAVEHANLL